MDPNQSMVVDGWIRLDSVLEGFELEALVIAVVVLEMIFVSS